MSRLLNSKDKQKRKPKSFWSISDTRFLKENYWKMTNKELFKHLNKSINSIQHTARELRLLKIGETQRQSVDKVFIYDNISGIYYIENLNNGKLYIGYSENIGSRLKGHFCCLNTNKHKSVQLQTDFNNGHHFVTGIIEKCNGIKCIEREQMYINTYPVHMLYNLNKTIVSYSFNKKFRLKFWKKVKVGEKNECWLWLGKLQQGYGGIQFNGKHYSSHRIAFFITYGFQDGIVRHICDNPKCCNPRHLIIGTDKDNWNDCVSRNRNKPRISRFTQIDIDNMRKLSQDGKTQLQIAQIYKTSDGNVCRLLSGKVLHLKKTS